MAGFTHDSVLSHSETVQLIAVEVHSLLLFVDCARCGGDWCLLIVVLLPDNNQVLVLLMGQ